MSNIKTKLPEDVTPIDWHRNCSVEDTVPCGTNRAVLICSAQKCDKIKDCPDGEDEDDCPAGTKCLFQFFLFLMFCSNSKNIVLLLCLWFFVSINMLC